MRPAPAVIRLGDQAWTVRPLTVGQIQAIEPLLARSAATPSETVASAVAILKVALRRDNPAAADLLDEIEAGAPDISAALADVLRLGGYLPDAAAQTGTGAPGKPDADSSAERSTGPRSMPD